MELEFIALATAGKEVDWFRTLLLDINFLSKSTPKFLCFVMAKKLCLACRTRFIMEILEILFKA